LRNEWGNGDEDGHLGLGQVLLGVLLDIVGEGVNLVVQCRVLGLEVLEHEVGVDVAHPPLGKPPPHDAADFLLDEVLGTAINEGGDLNPGSPEGIIFGEGLLPQPDHAPLHDLIDLVVVDLVPGPFACELVNHVLNSLHNLGDLAIDDDLVLGRRGTVGELVNRERCVHSAHCWLP